MISLIDTLKKYISSKIPDSQTNILFMIVNGIGAVVRDIDYKLNIRKRENNILTANYDSSLRSIAAMNGFEPTLKIPSRGVVEMFVESKLFNRVGYPLYLPAYAVFKNKNTGIEYYYDSDKVLKIDSNKYRIPLVEGSIKSTSKTSTGQKIERVYIKSKDVANGSVVVEVNGEQFTEVKSFFDNEGLYEKMFLIKYSEKPSEPIIVYVYGAELNDTINVTYRITLGETGNINYLTDFITEDFIDLNGNSVTVDDTEITIKNLYGFKLGSNGTTKDALRASIGYNHGQTLLFDSVSYTNYINKYSTLMLQKIRFAETSKAINYIYVLKRQSYNKQIEDNEYQYKQIVENKRYILEAEDKSVLDEVMNYHSFCLSSHVLYDPDVCRYAIQILFETHNDELTYQRKLTEEIYGQFIRFFITHDFVLNFKTLIEDFMEKNNVKFEYKLFNEYDEKKKLADKNSAETSYIIRHGDALPILSGNFQIADSEYNPVDLFFDINIACKERIEE